jgi:integrase/recombinase XerD
MGSALRKTRLSSEATARRPVHAGDATDPAVLRFLDATRLRRGVSGNALAAYRTDLSALSHWLAERNTPILRATRADLLSFIAGRVEAGARPSATARQLSSFRRFFRYLVRDAVLRADPTTQLAMPRIGRSLPKTLSEAEVESLLLKRPEFTPTATHDGSRINAADAVCNDEDDLAPARGLVFAVLFSGLFWGCIALTYYVLHG